MSTKDDSHYRRNIEAILSRYPRFKTEIIERYSPADDAVVEQTSSGYPTIRYRGAYLHSRKNPVREADKVIASGAPEHAGSCVVLGFGLGYFVESFRNTYPALPVVVIEPDVPLFLHSLEVRDLSQLLSDERLSLFLDIDVDSIRSVLSQLPEGHVHLLCPRSLYRLNPSYFDKTRAALTALLDRRQINKNTLKRFGTLWIRNLVRNLPLLSAGKGIADIASLYKDIPAVVVAAGPSLDSITPVLTELSKRALIIAVDTSLRACLNAGVRPDFLVVVDPQYWNTRHLDGCDTSDLVLLSETSTHPTVFRRRFSNLRFCSSLFPLGRYIESRHEEFGKLGAGGSVATTAWDFARFLGCSPIYCAGLDLGFPDAKTHFHGSRFEELSHSLSTRLLPAQHASFLALHDAGPFPVRANDGKLVYTDRRLILYKNWFESRLQDDSEAISYNLSPNGVSIEGMEVRDVSSVAQHPVTRDRIDELFQKRVLGSGVENTGTPATTESPGYAKIDKHARVASIVGELISELESLVTTAHRGLDIVDKLDGAVRSNTDISGYLAALDEIDGRLIESETKDIAGFLMQELINEIAGTVSETDGAGVVERSRKLYRDLASSAQFHIDLLRWFEE